MKRSTTGKGGVVAALLISILVIAALALGAMLFTGLYVARNVRVERSDGAHGETVRVETPVGALQVRHGALDPAKLGIPMYPGATLWTDRGKAADLQFDFGNDHKELSITAAKFRTSDPAGKVIDYYRRQLPHWIVSHQRHGEFHMEYSEGGYKRIIVVKERSGTTEIALASVGEPGEN